MKLIGTMQCRRCGEMLACTSTNQRLLFHRRLLIERPRLSLVLLLVVAAVEFAIIVGFTTGRLLS